MAPLRAVLQPTGKSVALAASEVPNISRVFEVIFFSEISSTPRKETNKCKGYVLREACFESRDKLY